MTYLLDTNAVSEWVKPRPDPGVVSWLDEVDEDRTFLSVVTIGELRKGVVRLPASRRRAHLDRWLSEDLPQRFADRLLPVDVDVADQWGRILGSAESNGRSVNGIDALIAATAKVHGLEVVTRNVSHFRPVGVAVVCPWEG